MNLREYLQAIDTVDAAREARRQFKYERALNDSLTEAYAKPEDNTKEVKHEAL